MGSTFNFNALCFLLTLQQAEYHLQSVGNILKKCFSNLFEYVDLFESASTVFALLFAV